MGSLSLSPACNMHQSAMPSTRAMEATTLVLAGTPGTLHAQPNIDIAATTAALYDPFHLHLTPT